MAAAVPFPAPTGETGDPATLLVRQLRFYRATVLAKAASLDVADQRVARVPTGWAPLELVTHLVHMERRWIVWGFLGEPVDEPWGDHHPEQPGRWVVTHDVTLESLASRLFETAARTDDVLTTTSLETLAEVGGRFETNPPTLASIALHVLGEYARHAGHLDVAVELAGGATGE